MAHQYPAWIDDELWSGLVRLKEQTGQSVQRHLNAAVREYLGSGTVQAPIPFTVVVSGVLVSGSVGFAVRLGVN